MNIASKLRDIIQEMRETASHRDRSALEEMIWNWANQLAALAPPSGEGVDSAEHKLAAAGVFAGHRGLRGLAEHDAFWEKQAYGTRLYYGDGGTDYLHRGVLRAAVSILDQTTTPQSAPVDGDTAKKIAFDVESWADSMLPANCASSLANRVRALTTPPQASQERGGKPWRCEWEGSGPQRGWHIVEAVRLSNNERVAYLGQEIDSTAVDSIVAAHNATQRPAECADGCPPQQVCDFCQWTGGADASPPSSAAEDVTAGGTSTSDDELPGMWSPSDLTGGATDAAEQAKPHGPPPGYRYAMDDGEGHAVEVTAANGYVPIGRQADDGDFVLYCDYDQLRKRLAEIEVECREAWKQTAYWRHRAEQAEAKLAQAEQDARRWRFIRGYRSYSVTSAAPEDWDRRIDQRIADEAEMRAAIASQGE